MTQEVDFRVWDMAVEDWFYFNLIPFFASDSPHLTGERFKNVFEGKVIDPSRVCRGTGLKDRDGVYIYEGDIVQRFIGSTRKEYPERTKVVQWVSTRRYQGFNIGNGETQFYAWSVIGNIYENPELLKEVI